MECLSYINGFLFTINENYDYYFDEIVILISLLLHYGFDAADVRRLGRYHSGKYIFNRPIYLSSTRFI